MLSRIGCGWVHCRRKGVGATVSAVTRLYHESMKPIDTQPASPAYKSKETRIGSGGRLSVSPTPKSAKPQESGKLHSLSTQQLCALANGESVAKKELFNILSEVQSRRDVRTNELELLLKGLSKRDMLLEAIQVFKDVSVKSPNIVLTVPSVELLFSAIISKRQYNLATQIWDACSYDSRRRWGIWSVYCRCLLSDQQLEAARPLLNKLQMCSYSIPSANRSVIQGLYTGKYYEECLRFFNGLLELDAKGLLLGDALSFQLAIKSAYQMHDYRQVLSIYDRMVKSNLNASRPVVYIVSSVYEQGEFWRVYYEDKIRLLRDSGIIPTKEQQIQIFAQSRLPQWLKGGSILHAFGKKKGEGILTYNSENAYFANVEKYYDPHRRLKLIALMDEVSELRGVKDTQKLLIRSLPNDAQLTSLLSGELYPTIDFSVHDSLLSIPLQSILHWKNHREDPVL